MIMKQTTWPITKHEVEITTKQSTRFIIWILNITIQDKILFLIF